MAALRASLLLAAALIPPLAGATDPSSTLAQRIDAILERPAAQRTHWGILAVDLNSGETLYQHNQQKLFLPASNVKMFSTAIALHRLGADYSFTTRLTAEGDIDENGTLDGDLRLIGGGDPNLSSRPLPYRKGARFGADRLQPLRALARAVREAGIRRVSGDIIGDDSRYIWQPYPRGWSYLDTLQAYGSPASALVFNDNMIELLVTPGAASQPARIRILPPLEFYEISNQTRTLAGRFVDRRLLARWGAEEDQVVLAGQIPARSNGTRFQLAANDPALYAAAALKRALADAGIETGGSAISEHRLPDRLASLRSPPPPARAAGGTVLASVESAPLREAVRVINKESQNLHAEMLLREVALQDRGIGTQEATVDSLRRFLAEAGLHPAEFVLRDGSGLSRQNLLSPAATVALLRFVWQSDFRETFAESLPLAGDDGTLSWRFRRTVARGRLRAKTGSMSHVLGLSGYVSTVDDRDVAFSLFANNFGIVSSSTRHLLDSIATELVDPRPR